MASLLVLGGDRGYFYRHGSLNGEITHKTLTVAENLSPRHNFLMALRVWERADGGFEYYPYGRFPIGGFVLTKAAIAPFGNDLAAKLLAARVLAMLMFCGAAVFAYLALARIAGNRWAALAATSLAFSGLYALYHADVVLNEGVMSMFGVMLAFHGIVVFIQEGRFGQLLAKTCAALLLGWHAYALVTPFAALGLGGEAVALVRSAVSDGGGIRAALTALPALARNRYAALAAFAILFGSALLAFNFATEYMSYDGNRALSELPSLRSILGRLGATDFYEDEEGGAGAEWWGGFFRRQFHRAGVASAPYAAARIAGYEFPRQESSTPSLAWAAWGLAATCAALAATALFPRRFRAPFAALALTGFC